MNRLSSVRMRASKRAETGRAGADGQKEVHVSGAEGLYERSDVRRAVKSYFDRALAHPKGRPDKIIITIEAVTQRPKLIRALPVSTIECKSPSESKTIITDLLRSLGISGRAVTRAFTLMKKGHMRGAAIINRRTGSRLDPREGRGIRVSRLGITKKASRSLSSGLARRGINTDTVKEALVLASKVASCEGITAELCISDDPDYTTGYVASGRLGYVRIPHIKRIRSRDGGRVFFVREGFGMDEAREYLERFPVLVGKAASCGGVLSIDEFFNSPHQ